MNVPSSAKALAVELALADQAQADAVAGLPNKDAQAMTAAETKAIDAAWHWATKEVQKVNDGRLAAGSALDECRSTLHQVVEARRGIENETPPRPRNFGGLERERDEASAAYRAFKSNHKLTRDAARDDRITQLTWAAVVIVIESMVNSYFYMPISDLGLLGGFFTALFVSVVNVAFAFVGGALGLRFIGHIEPSKKLGGVTALLICLLICALVVALSALFRGHVDDLNARGLDTTTLMESAWKAAVESLSALDVWALFSSLNSFLLMFVGTLCAVVGFWKGWAYDDPYPGFGAAHRHKEQTQHDYDDALEEEDQRQNRWRNERKGRLRSQAERLGDAANAMHAARTAFDKLVAEAQGIGEATALLVKELLSVYRDGNRRVRATAPPSYFDEYQGPSDFASLDADLQNAADALPNAQADARRLTEECDKEKKAIQRAIGAIDG